MQRNCDFCGEPYEAKRPNSKYHNGTCRKRAARTPKSAPVAQIQQRQTASGDSTLVAATQRTLEQIGRLDSVVGRQALALAGRIDSPHETGAAVASLSKEFRAVMDAVLDGVAVEVNPLDELRARRERKLAGG